MRRGKRSRSRSVSLPWEQRTRWLSGALSGPSWRIPVVVLGAVLVVSLLYVAAARALRSRSTHAAIEDVHRATIAFIHDHDRCPTEISELLDPPEGRRYLRDIPVDGWGQELFFAVPVILTPTARTWCPPVPAVRFS